MIIFLLTILTPIVCLLILQFYIIYQNPKIRKAEIVEHRIDRMVHSYNKTDKKIFLNFVDHSKLFSAIQKIKDTKYID